MTFISGTITRPRTAIAAARKILSAALALFALAIASMPARAEPVPSLDVAMVCPADLRMKPLEVLERSPQSLLALVYEPLVTLDDERRPQPMLAERWENVGGNIWEFTIRSGVKFHDGRELTAQDAVDTLNAISALAKQGLGLYQQVDSILSTWEVKGTNILRVKAKKPSYSIVYAMTFPILPSGSADYECPPGTGPYRIEFYQPGSQLALSVSDIWWQRAPRVRVVTGRWYKTDADAMSAFQAEDIHVLATRSLQATRYRGIIGSAVTSLQYSTRQLELLLFNNGASKLKTPSVRQAICHAIDKGRLAAAVYQNVVSPTDTIAAPGTWLYNSSAASYGYNPERASRLLESEGWSQRNEAGFLVNADGQPFSLRLFYYDEEGSSLRHDAAFLVKDMLAQVGIDAQITYYQFENGKAKLDNGDYDLFLCAVNFGQTPDPGFLLARSSASNYARYRGNDIAGLLNKLDAAQTPDEYSDAWMNLQKQIGEDPPFMPLYWRGGMLLLRGVYLSARDIREYETLRTFAESNR